MKTIMITILAALITSTLQAEPTADDLFIAGIKVTLVSKMDSHDCQGWQLALKRIRAAAGFARQYQQAAHETPNPQLMRVARFDQTQCRGRGDSRAMWLHLRVV